MNVSSWLMAARPRTLALSFTPVAVGAALAWAVQRQVHGPAVCAALLGSVFIQAGTNLHNDAADCEHGGDGPDRLGPPRVTSSGLLPARTVKHAAFACFTLAGLTGLYLVAVGGWPILVLGLLSIASGWAYTGGRWPIAYTPLGELFVVAFFGVGAVAGTYWLCAGRMGAPVFPVGLALGLMAAAVLLVNNFRDREADARVGRRTLAIVAKARTTAAIYAAMMLVPFALLLPVAHALPQRLVGLAWLALPASLMLVYRFARESPGRGFNRILAWTVQVQVLFSLLLAAGLLL